LPITVFIIRSERGINNNIGNLREEKQGKEIYTPFYSHTFFIHFASFSSKLFL